MNTCAITDCERPVNSLGLCAVHYRRKLRGSPNWDRPAAARTAPRCIVEGCDAHVLAKAMCSAHYARQQKYGDPTKVMKKRSATGICAFSGCEKPHDSLGFCSTHAARVRKSGDVNVTGKGGPKRRPGHRSLTKSGYVALYLPDHVLATKSGLMLEHRSVLFDKIGLGPHRCHHCSAAIGWRWPLPHRLETDHLDWDKTNNTPGNLVPSCIHCNSQRRKS